jgi:uracil-DNA glycosylase
LLKNKWNNALLNLCLIIHPKYMLKNMLKNYKIKIIEVLINLSKVLGNKINLNKTNEI